MGWQAFAAQGVQDISGMAYNAYWQNRTENRQDSEVQRRAADLERAGLSKTLAAGGAGHTMAPIVSDDPIRTGDAVQASAQIDLAKRDQDNKDRLTQAQVENINAQSELVRKQVDNTGSQTNLRNLEIGSYQQKLESELKEAVSRIDRRAQENLDSEQSRRESEDRIKSGQQSRSESRQRVEESRSRVVLNSAQQRLAEQAHEKGILAMQKLTAEIENDRRQGRSMDLEYKLKMLEAIKNSANNLRQIQTGNSQYSYIGKVASDIEQLFHGFGAKHRSAAVDQYIEAYTEMLNSIQQ